MHEALGLITLTSFVFAGGISAQMPGLKHCLNSEAGLPSSRAPPWLHSWHLRLGSGFGSVEATAASAGAESSVLTRCSQSCRSSWNDDDEAHRGSHSPI